MQRCYCRTNVKSVFVQATVLGIGQSLIFYLYAAGYYFGAYLVTENRTTYDAIFQLVQSGWIACLLLCVTLVPSPECLQLLCSLLSPSVEPAPLLQMRPKLKSQLLRSLHFSTENLKLMHQAARE